MVKASELIESIGKEIYGEKFSIEEKRLFEAYKKVYQNFINEKRNAKGVFVLGDLGIGKSAMMRVFHRLFKDTDRCFKWVAGMDLKDMAEELTTGQIKNYYGYDLKCDLYIDDIGFTVDVKRYGNTVNIITEIIMNRYDLFISSGFRTHISSNVALTSADPAVASISKIYGNRVLDRLKEMNELVAWNSESLRK